jgi:hypothetical protein
LSTERFCFRDSGGEPLAMVVTVRDYADFQNGFLPFIIIFII